MAPEKISGSYFGRFHEKNWTHTHIQKEKKSQTIGLAIGVKCSQYKWEQKARGLPVEWFHEERENKKYAIKSGLSGHSSWSSGWGSTCPCRGHRFISGREDATRHRAAKPMHHNYWACALEPALHNKRSPHSQQLERAHKQQQRLSATKNKIN